MTTHQTSFSETALNPEKDQGFGFYFSVLRRRLAYFLIPAVAVATIGTVVALLLPGIYHSEARILVQSQQIPEELVRSTVTSGAEERIGVIEQRIMTRDNLLAIASKFGMFNKWRGRVSDTDLVDLMRERAAITPVALNVGRRTPASAIAFTVSFEYEDPAVTMKVANELVTLILNEDVRTRTARAAETTKFLEQESNRLEQALVATEAQIAEVKQGSGSTEVESQLAALKVELFQKSSIYSPTHPIVLALKNQIAALEQQDAPSQATPTPPPTAAPVKPEASDKKEPAAASDSNSAQPSTLSFLQNKQESLQTDLDAARRKLLAARQGERLEADQQSERFEVIEQPALPQEPVKPNRKKMTAFSFALAIAAGLGGIFAIESYDKTMRGPSDLPVPNRLVVTIPYISTRAELNRAQQRRRFTIGALVVLLLIVVALVHFLVLPLDLLFEKIQVRLGF
jgi:uncharacterized protein involved in exopolysaccharide biosynthesis